MLSTSAFQELFDSWLENSNGIFCPFFLLKCMYLYYFGAKIQMIHFKGNFQPLLELLILAFWGFLATTTQTHETLACQLIQLVAFISLQQGNKWFLRARNFSLLLLPFGITLCSTSLHSIFIKTNSVQFWYSNGRLMGS